MNGRVKIQLTPLEWLRRLPAAGIDRMWERQREMGQSEEGKVFSSLNCSYKSINQEQRNLIKIWLNYTITGFDLLAPHPCSVWWMLLRGFWWNFYIRFSEIIFVRGRVFGEEEKKEAKCASSFIAAASHVFPLTEEKLCSHSWIQEFLAIARRPRSKLDDDLRRNLKTAERGKIVTEKLSRSLSWASNSWTSLSRWG